MTGRHQASTVCMALAIALTITACASRPKPVPVHPSPPAPFPPSPWGPPPSPLPYPAPPPYSPPGPSQSPTRNEDRPRGRPASSPSGTVPADAKGYCDVVNRRLSAADCDAAIILNARAVGGHPRANIPSQMFKGETAEVTLAIGMPGAAEALASEAVGGGAGPAISFSAKVGPRMKAELVGAGFRVRLLPPQTATQDLGDGFSTWTWDVVPLADGEQRLWIRTSVIFTDENGAEHVLVPTSMAHQVKVVVRPLTLIQKIRRGIDAAPGWLKSITAIISGIAALIAAIVALTSTARKKSRAAP